MSTLLRGRAQARPSSPAKLTRRHWAATLRRTVREFGDDGLTDWAAAMTYYAVLAILPGFLVLIALIGLFGEHPRTTNTLLELVGDLGPPAAVELLRGPVEEVVTARGGAGALLGFGLLGAIWSASGYTGAFIRATNAIYERNETRPFWIVRPLQVAITLALTLAFSLALIAIVISGSVARAVGDTVGLGGTAVTAWGIAKWPVLAALLAILIAALYHVAPNVRQPAMRWVTPGGAFAVVAWLIASALFGIYVSHFASYNAAYGSLGGVVAALIWVWITNLALLLGAKLDAELERTRELASGNLDALSSIQLPAKR